MQVKLIDIWIDWQIDWLIPSAHCNWWRTGHRVAFHSLWRSAPSCSYMRARRDCAEHYSSPPPWSWHSYKFGPWSPAERRKGERGREGGRGERGSWQGKGRETWRLVLINLFKQTRQEEGGKLSVCPCLNSHYQEVGRRTREVGEGGQEGGRWRVMDESHIECVCVCVCVCAWAHHQSCRVVLRAPAVVCVCRVTVGTQTLRS